MNQEFNCVTDRQRMTKDDLKSFTASQCEKRNSRTTCKRVCRLCNNLKHRKDTYKLCNNSNCPNKNRGAVCFKYSTCPYNDNVDLYRARNHKDKTEDSSDSGIDTEQDTNDGVVTNTNEYIATEVIQEQNERAGLETSSNTMANNLTSNQFEMISYNNTEPNGIIQQSTELLNEPLIDVNDLINCDVLLPTVSQTPSSPLALPMHAVYDYYEDSLETNNSSHYYEQLDEILSSDFSDEKFQIEKLNSIGCYDSSVSVSSPDSSVSSPSLSFNETDFYILFH